MSWAGIHITKGKDKWITRVWKASKASGSLETFKHSLRNKTKTVEWTVGDVIALVEGRGNCHRAPGRPEGPAAGPPPWGPSPAFLRPQRGPAASSHFPGQRPIFRTVRLSNVRCTRARVWGRDERRVPQTAACDHFCMYVFTAKNKERARACLALQLHGVKHYEGNEVILRKVGRSLRKGPRPFAGRTVGAAPNRPRSPVPGGGGTLLPLG